MKVLTLLGLIVVITINQIDGRSIDDIPVVQPLDFFTKLQDAGADYKHNQNRQHQKNKSAHILGSERYGNDHVLVVPTEYGRVRGRAARTGFIDRLMDKVLGWMKQFKLDARQYPRAFEG
jgi:hypothetical protein